MNKKEQVLEIREKDDYFSDPSCNIEHAVMLLLGFSLEDIRPAWVPNPRSSQGGEWLDSSGFDLMTDSLHSAEIEYEDAIYDQCSEEIIKQKSDEVKRCKKEIEDGNSYRLAIIDEFENGSAFRTIKKQTNLDGYPSIRLYSLKKWAKEVLKISILDNTQLPLSLTKSINPILDEIPPWIKNKQSYDNPPTEYEWQLAARYYAVEYLKENKDFINQVDLAEKVAGIMKRLGHRHGVNSEYDATTIRKAFPKFKFNGIKLSLIYEFFQKTPSNP